MSNQITTNPSVPSQVVAEVKFPQVINNLGIIPTSYKDSMSYYECLAWLCKYLQETVIPTLNQNGMAVQELQGLYIELNEYVTNYFDNLDVQEEINNKLDQMVEEGTLQEIITQYIQSTALWVFDTVEDMKSATNLINGSYAKTLGYYALNDGGGANYVITDTESQTEYQETLESGLYASLVTNKIIHSKQVGCKVNDNTFDNSTKLQSMFNIQADEYILDDGTHYVDLSSITNLELKYSNIKLRGQGNAKIEILPNALTNYAILKLYQLQNVVIENITLIGDKDTHTSASGEWGHCLGIWECANILVKDSTFEKAWGDGIYEGLLWDTIPSLTIDNIKILNCNINDNSRNGISLTCGNNLLVDGCKISSTDRTPPKAGIDIEPEFNDESYLYMNNVTVQNCISNNNGKFVQKTGFEMSNINILNNISINDLIGVNFIAIDTSDTNIIGNVFKKSGTGIYVHGCEDNCILNINDNTFIDGQQTTISTDQCHIYINYYSYDSKNINIHNNTSIGGPTYPTFGLLIFASIDFTSDPDAVVSNISINNFNTNKQIRVQYAKNTAQCSNISIENVTKTQIISLYTYTLGDTIPWASKLIQPSLPESRTINVSNILPDGYYEIISVDTQNHYNDIIFNSAYTIFDRDNSENYNKYRLAFNNFGKLGFYKNGTNIYITEKIGSYTLSTV